MPSDRHPALPISVLSWRRFQRRNCVSLIWLTSRILSSTVYLTARDCKMTSSWYGDYVARLDKYKTNAAPSQDYASVAGVNLNGLDLPELASNGVMDHLKDAG